MSKLRLLASATGVRLTGRNFLAPAVIALASLGAGCAAEPQQATQAAAVQSTSVSTTAPAAAVAGADNPLECEYLVPAGTATHKWFCFPADQAAAVPVAARDDDPLLCQYVAGTGTMVHKWNCVRVSEMSMLQQQRRRRVSGVEISD